MDAETHYDALELQVIDQQGYEYIRYERITSVAIKRGLEDESRPVST